MQAIVLRAFGSPDNLRPEIVPDPAPGPGEVLLRVETGALRSWVSDVLPLHEAAQAHDRLEKREVAGRLVLEPVH